MSQRAARVVAWGIWTVCATTVGASLVLLALVKTAPGGGTDLFYSEDAVVGLMFPAVGTLIITHRPYNAVGWLLCLVGVSAAFGVFGEEYVTYGLLVRPGSLPAVDLVAWMSGWVWFSFFGLIPLVLLVFPDGRIPTPRWRFLARAIVVLTVGVTLFLMVATRNLPAEVLISSEAAPSLLPGWSFSAIFIALLLAALASLASLAVRWRRAELVERQQLKWFLAFAIAGQAVPYLSTFWPAATEVFGVIGLLFIPAGIGIAILRYRLYEIDRIISRTVSYLLLSGLLAAVYAAGVLILRPLLGQITNSSDAAVAASTLAVAALFGPARRRIQIAVDRRFNRTRFDARRTVQRFASQFRDGAELGELTASLLAVVHETLQPAQASLWLREPSVPLQRGARVEQSGMVTS